MHYGQIDGEEKWVGKEKNTTEKMYELVAGAGSLYWGFAFEGLAPELGVRVCEQSSGWPIKSSMASSP